MRYKNTFPNPIAGIRPNGIGEVKGKQAEKIERFIELGMLEEVKETKAEAKKDESKDEKQDKKGFFK